MAQHPPHGSDTAAFRLLYQELWDMVTRRLPADPRKTVAARALLQAKFGWRDARGSRTAAAQLWNRGAVGSGRAA